MSYSQYSKIILPTIDTVLCRGPSIFAQPSANKGDDGRVIVLMPSQYFYIIRDKSYRNIVGYEPGLEELFNKTSEDMGRFVKKHRLGSGDVVQLNNRVDVKFIDINYQSITTLVRAVEAEIKKTGGNLLIDSTKENSIFKVQAALNMAQADLVFNGMTYEIPRYEGLGPEISDKFLVEIDNTSNAEMFEALTAKIIEDTIKRGDDYDPERIFYIPVDAYSEIVEITPIANQFLIMTDLTKEESGRFTAYRLKFDKRRFERVDLDARVNEISHIWKPKLPLHIRQKLALDLLLDDDISMVYLSGGKQTGKTSLAMAAFESKTFGRGRKHEIDVPITLIKSGLAKNIKGEALMTELMSFQGSFLEQEIGVVPFEELCMPKIARKLLKEMTYLPTKSSQTKDELRRDAIFLPDTPVFRLLPPAEEEGMSFHGFTIRDECQNEYPYVMNRFRDRRGIGAKYALLGDIYDQISRPGLDEYWNGLLLNLSKNIGLAHVAGITLTEKWSDRQLK